MTGDEDSVAVTTEGVWPDSTDADEGVVVTWFVREDRSVSEGDSLCEIQIEKVSVDVPAPVGGTLVEIVRESDDEFERGDVLAWIDPG